MTSVDERSMACLNGVILPVEEARVPVNDRGYFFGDAVYEVFRLYSGRCWLEREHWSRLERSVREIHIDGVDYRALADRVQRTIEASGVKEGTAYIQISRGVAPRKHTYPDPTVPPTELVVVRPYDDAPMAQLRQVGTGVIVRPDLRWGRCDIKSTNLLANVMAQEEAKRAGCFEAVFVDREGFITEATHSSLLWVRGGRLEGTPEGPSILPGTTRHNVIGLANALGIGFAEVRITLEAFQAAEEILLTGTTCEVLPVVAIDGRPLGDGRPGPVARRLQDAHSEALAVWLNSDAHAPVRAA